MDTQKARASFSQLTKQNWGNSSWKRAVSWLYHCEPEETVVNIFNLDQDQLNSAKQAVGILYAEGAEYDKVHAWANNIKLKKMEDSIKESERQSLKLIREQMKGGA